uniref:Uncharacterized protein n=1 Tax=Panagrolaimus davidi TaxID=227884 RepID=A0A914QPV8_9BILA
MFYILMNPISAKKYKKMIKSCKYFFVKNSILIVNYSIHNGDQCSFNIAPTNITSKTFTELLEIPHFSKLKSLQINNIPDIFDIEAFCTYMKKNRATKFDFLFVRSVCDAYKARLEEIVDEILATEVLDYNPPLLYFHGFYYGKYMRLLRCFKKFV